MKCEDCKGTGKYVGLIVIEPCAACGGSGEVAGSVKSHKESRFRLRAELTMGTVNCLVSFLDRTNHQDWKGHVAGTLWFKSFTYEPAPSGKHLTTVTIEVGEVGNYLLMTSMDYRAFDDWEMLP